MELWLPTTFWLDVCGSGGWLQTDTEGFDEGGEEYLESCYWVGVID
jgi:hypothetical protein